MKPRAWGRVVLCLLLAACGGHGLKLKKDTAVDPIPQIRASHFLMANVGGANFNEFVREVCPMKGVIRVGDKTTGGGVVASGSAVMKFHGIGVARMGDTVSCAIPGHGPTVIAEGHPVFNDHGVPVAFHGHRCACGCVLLTSLPQATAS